MIDRSFKGTVSPGSTYVNAQYKNLFGWGRGGGKDFGRDCGDTVSLKVQPP